MYKVYSMAGCASCTAAINLLTTKQEDFTVLKIDENPAAAAFIKAEGHRSMPQIYKDDVLIPGGFQGLVKHLK